MKKWLILVLIILLAGSLLPGCGQQQSQQQTQAPAPAKKKFVVATAPGFYPFQMMAKDGQLIGYNIDLGKDLGEYLGMEVEFKGFNGIPDMVSALQAKQADVIISGATITEKRKETMDFSDPYFDTYLSIMVNNKYKDLKNWEELDKPDITIAITFGSTGDTIVSQMFKKAIVKKYDSTALVGLAMLNGQADLTIQDDTWTNIYQMYYPDKLSVIVPRIGGLGQFGIVVAKDNKELLDKVNIFLKKYKESGAEAKNYDKWFKSDSWKDLVPPKK